ncbi:MAG: SDR family NAD(P)-dependent oxidoreductase, partial [Pseudomonadota bacterium]
MSDDRFSVAGRIACVTGASSGIGQAMADALAEAGARVVGIARREEALASWAAGAGERAALVGDVGDLDALPDLA